MTKRKPIDPNRVCAFSGCGKPLPPEFRSDRKFCSSLCNERDWRERRRPSCRFSGCVNAVHYGGGDLCSGHRAQLARGDVLAPLAARRRINGNEKRCACCEQVKTLDKFQRRAKRDGQVTSYCSDCLAIYKLARHYGVSFPEMKRLRSVTVCQNPRCGRTLEMCVDHCHDTGIVRGVLCKQCNLALGHVADDAERLRGLIEYLERPRNLRLAV